MVRLERLYASLSPRAWLALIVLVGAALRLAMAPALWGNDDLNYAYAAWIESGHFFDLPDDGHVQTHHDLRKGLILPTALLYAAFGVHPWTTGAWSFACSIGLILLAHRFGRLLLESERAALLTALFAATFPLDVIFAGTLWPTEPQAFFMASGVYLFLRAERRAERGEPPRAAAYLGAGLAIGVGYLVHITALFLGLFFIAYLLLYRRRWKWQILLVGAGVAAVIAGESLAYYPFHGEWLYPIKQVNRSQNLGLGWGYIPNWEGTSRLVEGTAAGESFWLSPWAMLLLNQEFAAYYIAALPAMAWAAWRAPALRPALLWFVTVFLWTAYGTTTPDRWVWLGRMPRYYAPVTIPALLALTWAVVTIARRGRPRLAGVLAAGLAATGVLGAAVDDGTNTWHAAVLVERVKAEPEAVFGTDHQTYAQARYYNGFRPLPRVRVLTRPPEAGGLYRGADVRPFEVDGIDRLFHHPANWDLSIRQPENCGAADKSGALRPDCPAVATLAAVRAWGPPEPVDPGPRTWICAPAAALGDVLPARVREALCRRPVAFIYRRGE